MARLWSSGAELNSVTANVEYSVITNSPLVTTDVPRSGTYSSKFLTTSNATRLLSYQYRSADTQEIIYFRAYLYIVDPVDSVIGRSIISFRSVGAGAEKVGIRMQNDQTLYLYNIEDSTQIGSDSSPLNTGQWYRIELMVDTTTLSSTAIEAKIDGVTFASGTVNLTAAVGMVRWGSLDVDIYELYYDDMAINDSSGSFQNSWPGEGEIIHLNVDSDGDNSGWDNGVASFNYENVDENTPDDASTVNESSTVDQIDDYNLAATPAAMESGDTINCVQVGVRARSDGTQTNSFVLRIKAAASGTVEESSNISTTNTTWFTNLNAAPRNYQLTLYDLPGASTTAWTKADLDTTQIGQRLTVDGGAFRTEISKVWLLVDHKPTAASGGAFVYPKQRMRWGMGV